MPYFRLTASLLFVLPLLIRGQDANIDHPPTVPASSANPQPGEVIKTPSGDKIVEGGGKLEDKRVLGVLPNYRTASGQGVYQPLTERQKFYIFYKDSTDYPVFGLTAFFAGLSQVQGNDNSIYGQGVKGFAHRFGISYADQVTGNFFPEFVLPVLTHTDPRYFRKGEGSKKSRLAYALERLLVCRSDSGAVVFNSPEIIGNITAAGFSRVYHPGERTLGDAAEQFGSYLQADAVGQVLKEFWPDIKHWYKNRHNNQSAAQALN